MRKLLEVEERGCVTNFIARAKAIAQELHPNRIIDNTKLTNFKSAFKGAVSAFRGVSQISNSFVWIDLLLDKDYSDMHKNAKNAILAEL